MSDINSQKDYSQIITNHERKKALRTSQQNRKFEIDLYWKRAGYYWAIIGAVFAVYALSMKFGTPQDEFQLLVSNFGLVISFGWYLANRGSRFWSLNWEKHVDYLEDEELGPLFKTIISKTNFKFLNLLDAYPFSVTKINHAINLYVIMIWIILMAYSFGRILDLQEPFRLFNEIAITFLSLMAIILTFHFGRSNLKSRSGIKMQRRDLG